jgi:hypothetical protein
MVLVKDRTYAEFICVVFFCFVFYLWCFFRFEEKYETLIQVEEENFQSQKSRIEAEI